MDLAEDLEGYVRYVSFPTESVFGAWSYWGHRYWVLQAHVVATLLATYTDAYVALLEPAWTTHMEAKFAKCHHDDVGWQMSPADFEGRSVIIPVETGRVFFPASREAIEEAAYYCSSGAFVVPQTFPQRELVALVRQFGFQDLTEELLLHSLAHVAVDSSMDVEVYMNRLSQERTKVAVRVAVMTWDNPAAGVTSNG